MTNYLTDPRFEGIKPFENRVWLASPTMHGDEQKWVNDAFEKNWITTAGENIDEIERLIAVKVGRKQTVALSAGTAALHLAIKLAGEKLYGQPMVGHGTLEGKKVFCSDMTFDATINGICYENGTPVFIDSEYETWNMDPKSLEKAFEASRIAAFFLGPNTRRLCFSNSSTIPPARGSSIPTTVRSISFSNANSISLSNSIAPIGTHSANSAIPAFPGAQ